MSEKEKNIADDIVQIFIGLPESKKQRLLGVAEGMKMVTDCSERQGANKGGHD